LRRRPAFVTISAKHGAFRCNNFVAGCKLGKRWLAATGRRRETMLGVSFRWKY
jgi:hypothetical protein